MAPASRLTLPKASRLRSRKFIGLLFREGRSVHFPPVKMVYAQVPLEPSVQAAFSVPSRTFSRAVDRNLLRRRMREAYRLHQSELAGLPKRENTGYAMMFIYTSRERLPYAEIEKGIVQVISSMVKKEKDNDH